MTNSNYPAQIDNSSNLPQVIDNKTAITGSVFNALRSAIIAIESTLGTNPNGPYGTIANRLITLENLITQIPIIQIDTKDIGGTDSLPLVIGIQGRPVADTAPIAGQSLAWNGIAWIPTTISGGGGSPSGPAGGDLSGLYPDPTVAKIQGNAISATAPTAGQFLIENSDATGSAWTSLSGDVSDSPSSVGKITVTGLQSVAVPAPSGSNTVLTYNSGSLSWAAGGGGGGSPSGPASGDLSGSYPDPTVSGIQNNAVPAPSGSNTVLTWSGSDFSWAAGGGGGAITRPTWSSDIYVDPKNVTGLASDSNDGLTPETPFLTTAKVNSLLLLNDIVDNITIIYFSSEENYSLDLSTVILTNGSYLIIDGSLSFNYPDNIALSGTLTGQVAMDQETNTFQSVSDAANYLADYGGSVLVDTMDGPNFMNSCWLIQSYNYPTDSNTCYTTAVIESDDVSQGSLSIGDTYSLWILPTINVISTGNNTNIYWYNMSISGVIGTGQINQCYVDVTTPGGFIYTNNCYVEFCENCDTLEITSGFLTTSNYQGLNVNNFVAIANDTICPYILTVSPTTTMQNLIINNIWGYPSGVGLMNGMFIDSNGIVTNYSQYYGEEGLLWGSNGITINGGGALYLQVTPTPTITGDFAFNSAASVGSGVTTGRSWNEASGVWTSQIATTWANLYNSSVSFNNIQDVSTGSKAVVLAFDSET